MKKIQPLHLALGGGALVILGAFLPWASVSINFAGESSSHSTNGMDGDGKITLVLGLCAVGLTVLKNPAKTKLFALIALIAAGLAALIGLYDASQIGGNSDARAMMEAAGDAIKVSLGMGIYLTIIGGAAASVGSLMRWKSAPAPQSAAQPPAMPPAPPQG